jgi:light-regulated signal transduction histidine kinase (bacteriophytochrome)
MPKTQLRLHNQFDECESEDLIRHLRVQLLCGLIILDHKNTLIGASANLDGALIDGFVALAREVNEWPVLPSLLDGADRPLLIHEHEGTRFIEVGPEQQGEALPSQLALPQVDDNVYRYAQSVCDALFEQLDYDRVMVYRFLSDYSGEIIAETLAEGQEPFLGLTYPATDIPQQARALYRATRCRFIYSSSDDYESVELLAGQAPDMTLVSCRGVSPFHLQYLANMGSRSTASIAIDVDGVLWGLVSMHRSSAPPADLRLPPLFRDASHRLSDGFRTSTALQSAQQQERVGYLKGRFRTRMLDENDIASTLLMSSEALHRLVGGVGATVVAGDIIVQTGMTPDSASARALARDLIATNEDAIFVNSVLESGYASALEGLGGYAFLRFGDSSDTAIIIYRREVAQTVSWGGDPRHLTLAASEIVEQPYTPRASFARWVESVRGGCAEWDEITREIVLSVRRELASQYTAGDFAKLGVLLSYSCTQLAMAKERLGARIRAEFERSSQAIMVALQESSDVESSVIAINPAAALAFNIALPEGEEMPLSTFDSLSSLSLGSLRPSETQPIDAWTHDRGHVQLRARVGRYLEYENQGDGTFRRIMTFHFEDITEAQRVQVAIEAALKRSEQRTEIQAHAINKLLHEIRTPLNSIIGYSAFLSDESLSGLEREELVKRIATSSETLRDILNYADDASAALRTQADEQAVNIEINHFIAEVLSSLDIAVAEYGSSVVFTPCKIEAKVSAVPTALSQILTNLLLNAAKFSDAGGVISLMTKVSGGAVTISVADRGIGMTTDQVADAFRPFKRFTARPGSGLGLTIVKQLVEANAGAIDIVSEAAVGTKVSVTFPVSTNTE